MVFQVVENRFEKPHKPPCVLLERTTWDDHDYKTLFRAFHVTGQDPPVPLGRVKILEKGKRSPSLPSGPFETLADTFCSLGQEPQYYERLTESLGLEGAREALTALRDLALAPEVPENLRGEAGIKKSLLRFANAELARAEARRLLGLGEAPAAGPLGFTFSCKLEGFLDAHRIDFSFPPGKDDRLGRIMAIAGRNGTGKTQIVARLAQVSSGLSDDPRVGKLEPEQRARVVVVSFNTFDRFTAPRNYVPGGDYMYYGLRTPPARAGGERTRGEADIDRALHRLRDSVERIWKLGPSYHADWRHFLGNTGVFENEPGLVDPFQAPALDPHEMGSRIDDFIERLKTASSGHQLLVFIVTALVESVRERSLVLLDEPETHLHPRLLSTLLRLLYDMLTKRDAYAVIATHSPIVLQEIPGRSIRLLRIASRTAEGAFPSVKPYPRESFGEDLEEIVLHAFGVEEGDRSYRTILEQLVGEGLDRAQIEGKFDGLGLRAKLLLRDLLERRGAS